MNDMNKQDLLKNGIDLITEFCKINNINIPTIKTSKTKYSGYYTYGSNTLHINLDNCRIPQINPIRSWSFPGYFVDRTPIGVITHEFGHYLHEILGFPKMGKLGLQITNYEPNYEERFAETIKLFLTNPDLLKEYNIKRYIFLTQKLKLVPVKITDWKTTLYDYVTPSEKYINACNNRIINGQKKQK
jgi:hypothetical protein